MLGGGTHGGVTEPAQHLRRLSGFARLRHSGVTVAHVTAVPLKNPSTRRNR